MSTNTDTDTDTDTRTNPANDLALARDALLYEIDLAGHDLASDFDRLDSWAVSCTADAILSGADRAYLMKIRVQYLVRRNTAAVHAMQRVQNALADYYDDIAIAAPETA